MAVTIESASFSSLTAQPFGYDDSDVRTGQTARKWSITGLMTPAEWLALLEVYDDWRDLRIEDQDSLISESIGTTVTFSGSGPGDQTWTNIECWFSSSPSASQSGSYLSVSVELVDATQALEVLLRQQELSSQEDLPNFGTITLGTTTLTLKKPVDSYGANPSMELTATGVHYITGPLVPFKVKDIEGITNLTGWNNIRTWYESQISAVPASASWFPITSPSATAEKKIVNGVKVTQYTVTIQLGQVI